MRTNAFRVALVALLLLPGACLDRRESTATGDVNQCTACHGDPTRASSALVQAAPPVDLAGNTDPSYPGVGAHQIHLNTSSTHEAIPCKTCHVVPTRTDAPGHADSKLPAEVTLGGLALHDGYKGHYDAKSRSCSDTYCHRDANPVWNRPRESPCGTCHGLPPPPPHIQNPNCFKCHSETVDADRNIIDPSKHVNGTVDVVPLTCHTCHGSADNNAPPTDVSGNSDVSSPGVGAHQVHLSGGDFSRAVACSDCHVVPTSVDAPGHIDATPGAELTFSGIAVTGQATPSFDATTLTCKGAYCHGPEDPASSESPKWTSDASLTCTSCHGFPPAAPHPQMERCSLCHTETINTDNSTIKDRNKHVDGTVERTMPSACNACHGDSSATSTSTTDPVNAPPQDVAGETDTSARGVGAHQSHLQANGFARPVPCDECHVVPATVSAEGHFDTARPAELTFSGVAVTGGATPAFDGTRCNNTYCHGAAFPNGHASGGSLTQPTWTTVDGSQIACGSCHGLPPPAPHPTLTSSQTCSDCHTDINPDGVTFSDPDKHVNGKLD